MGQAEHIAERRLMNRLLVASTLHPPLQFTLCPARYVGRRMRCRVGSDTAVSAKRVRRRQEPGLVFPVGNADLARDVASRRGRPALHGRSQLRRTVIVAIEQNENGAAVALRTRQLNGSHDAFRRGQMITGPPDRPAHAHLPRFRPPQQTAKQDRESFKPPRDPRQSAGSSRPFVTVQCVRSKQFTCTEQMIPHRVSHRW